MSWQMTLKELSLAIEARSEKDNDYWETLSYMISGKKPRKKMTLDEVSSMMNGNKKYYT